MSKISVSVFSHIPEKSSKGLSMGMRLVSRNRKKASVVELRGVRGREAEDKIGKAGRGQII